MGFFDTLTSKYKNFMSNFEPKTYEFGSKSTPQEQFENSKMISPVSKKQFTIPPKEAEVYKQQISPQIQNQKRFYDTTKYSKEAGNGGQINQPPENVARLIDKYFPELPEATKAAIASDSESMYNPQAQNINDDGTIDRGLFQINNKTFQEYFSKFPKKMQEYGISSYDDMYDAEKNTAMAALIVNSLRTLKGDRVGWEGWYGPAGKGYNIYDLPDTYAINKEKLKNYHAE